jgi:hypothetical protein
MQPFPPDPPADFSQASTTAFLNHVGLGGWLVPPSASFRLDLCRDVAAWQGRILPGEAYAQGTIRRHFGAALNACFMFHSWSHTRGGMDAGRSRELDTPPRCARGNNASLTPHHSGPANYIRSGPIAACGPKAACPLRRRGDRKADAPCHLAFGGSRPILAIPWTTLKPKS